MGEHCSFSPFRLNLKLHDSFGSQVDFQPDQALFVAQCTGWLTTARQAAPNWWVGFLA